MELLRPSHRLDFTPGRRILGTVAERGCGSCWTRSESVHVDRSVPLNLRRHFDNIAEAYYQIVDRIWYDVGYYHKREGEFLREQLSQPLNLALDAGCGPGRHLLTLLERAHVVIAIDFSRQMLSKARDAIPPHRRGRIHFVQADVRRIPLRMGVTDLVINIEVLEHLPGGLADARSTLAEFRRVLKSHGSLVIEAPLERHRRWDHIWSKPASYKELTEEEKTRYYEKFPLTVEHLFLDEDLDSLLERAGFLIETKRYVRFFPAGLIERHPSLELVDKVIERVPFLNRVCREAMWYMRVNLRRSRKPFAWAH